MFGDAHDKTIRSCCNIAERICEPNSKYVRAYLYYVWKMYLLIINSIGE